MKSFGHPVNIAHHGLVSSARERMARVVASASFFAKVLVDKGKVA
ncbi:hypothetical protein [Neolewinella agarilytica]|uniref:Uncharacterized protein n=1 Tax=Neolewinella agarilytica TaxID=478744 RepID=A0A1H9JER5_9BACT|nr:hypothetical protein [Neolewinella agarilytica]SEQ85283.1 hypothetical protein SAMN05444359_11729 [Neolewinella agarilytica]